MKTSESIAVATVSLFEAVDLPFLFGLVLCPKWHNRPEAVKRRRPNIHAALRIVSDVTGRVGMTFYAVLRLRNSVKARQIFASGLSNRLPLAMASHCAVFKPVYQKFDTRRIYEINES